MLEFLYLLTVQPLVYLLETVFTLFLRATGSVGFSIIGISLVVNLFCLPLYQMADTRQRQERNRQKSMQKWVRHIKKHFKGDEQYMMLSAYYAEQNYHPAEAVFGSLSLLLQIPFFMAAYTFLSTLGKLNGASFLFLTNLGAPDATLSIAGITLNLMPLLMTALNCVSVAIYTKDALLRDKIQAYGLAVVFLVILYNSPSGLVFYWTCNQVFSLLKNVVAQHTRSTRMCNLLLVQFCVCVAAALLVGSGFVTDAVRGGCLFGALAVIEAVWVWVFVSERKRLRVLKTDGSVPSTLSELPRTSLRALNVQFVLAAVCLSLLLGLLIPSAVIVSSTVEFVDYRNLFDPSEYVFHTTSVWLGVFLVWTGVFYALSSERVRKVFVAVMWCLLGAFMVGYFLGKNWGVLKDTLKFQNDLECSWEEIGTNLAAVSITVLGMLALWLKCRKVVVPALAILCVALVVLAVPNMTTIEDEYQKVLMQAQNAQSQQPREEASVAKRLGLSRTEPNVVVLFMDRAISGYVPYIMHERPELAKQFDGFVYYPNTISFGVSTLFGSPSIYGGYEYTPTAMNARYDEDLASKHNEALRVMPTIFSEQGYESYVVYPPYTNYESYNVDASVFDGIDNTVVLNFKGAFTSIMTSKYQLDESIDLHRRFFCYSLFKVLPTPLQFGFYDDGKYFEAVDYYMPTSAFINEYAVLDMLPSITNLDERRPCLWLLHNETTHEPSMLQLPDYVPHGVVYNEGLEDMSRFTIDGESVIMSREEQLSHYHVNMVTYLKLGEWFDWLRSEGVYDNTRIIIVSDHGKAMGQWPDRIIDKNLELGAVNAVLMFKDFNATGFRTSNEFMTTGDVPVLAMEGIVDDPVNPYTGVAITDAQKYDHNQLVTSSWNYDPKKNNGKVFDTSDRPWYSVHDDIFNMDNWTRLD